MATPVLEEGQLAEELARRDKEKLQGTWNFVSGTREAELVILDDHFTIRFKNGEVYVGTFTLDPTRKPKAIDLLIQEGPRHQGQTALAIYSFDGKYLIWSPNRPGEGRPAFFPPPEDKEHLCIVFQREKRNTRLDMAGS